jgi:hypothetical protein
MSSDLLARKTTHFLLWRRRQTTPPPQLVIGRLQPGNPPTFVDQHRSSLQPSPSRPDVWEIPADQCELVEGQVSHYWFDATDSNSLQALSSSPCLY